jgi:branched-chain amino acid transport system permease protein
MAAIDAAAIPRSEVPASIKIAFAVLVVALVLAPLPPFEVDPVFLMKALCFALFACAFNLLIGCGGLLSFGHAMFFGWASYVAAHLAKVGTVSLPYWAGGWNWLVILLPPQSPEIAILGDTLVAAVLGVIVGAVAIRRPGIYFAMITLALAQMMYFFGRQAKFTGGEDGIQGVPRGRLFGIIDLSGTMAMYVFVVVVFLAAFVLIYRIVNSPFGEVLRAIRENEPRAISLGYKTERYKLVAFVLSATFAGLAGAITALVFQSASLADMHWTMSGEVVLMTLIGGLGTMFGPVVGAIAILAMQIYLATISQWLPTMLGTIFGLDAVVMKDMQTYLANFGGWVLVMQGAIFIACVLMFRRGVVGELAARLHIRL